MDIESIDEFDRDHELGCSLMMEFDCRKPFNTPTYLECSSSCCSHEKKFIEYLPIEEEMPRCILDDL